MAPLLLLVVLSWGGVNAVREHDNGTGGDLNFVEQSGNLEVGQVERIDQNANVLPDGCVLYWFYRSSDRPSQNLSQGGKAPREALATRATAIAELIASQSSASGNPLSITQLKAKIYKVAAIVYIVHEEAVVAVGALESFIGQYRFNTAEMGMLATDPNHRGKGLAGIVTTKLSRIGYKECKINTFFTVTRVTNYFSLKTQFFKGVKGLGAQLKGISTPVGYGFSTETPSKTYVVLLSPTGDLNNGILNTLSSETLAKCGPLALQDLKSASDIQHVQSSSITMDELEKQFEDFIEEVTETKNKVKDVKGYAGIKNQIAGWLGIQSKKKSGGLDFSDIDLQEEELCGLLGACED